MAKRNRKSDDAYTELRRQIMVAELPPNSLIDEKALVEALWRVRGVAEKRRRAAQAAAHQNVWIVGCEPFRNGVATLARLIDEGGLTNVRIYHEDVRFLLPVLAPAAFDRVFLMFPDPWPKKRHHQRRFVNRENLDHLARILRDGAQFRFASDHPDYVRWTLAAVRAHGAFAWTARRAADWLLRPADGAPTRFDEKALAAGRPPVYLDFVRRQRASLEGA